MQGTCKGMYVVALIPRMYYRHGFDPNLFSEKFILFLRLKDPIDRKI